MATTKLVVHKTTGTVKAEMDFGTVGSGDFDSILQAHVANDEGNSITVELIGDSAPAGGVTIDVDELVVTIHYESAVSTVGNVETAIAALAGTDDIIDTKTGGTGATVLTAPGDDSGPTNLADGDDGASDSFDAQYGNVLSAFGHVGAATTIFLQYGSEDSSSFFDGPSIVLAGAGDFRIDALTAAPWARLRSTNSVLVTGYLSSK